MADEAIIEGTETPTIETHEGDVLTDEGLAKEGDETASAEEIGGEELEGEHKEGEETEGEHINNEKKVKHVGYEEELIGEHIEGEHVEGEEIDNAEKKTEQKDEEQLEEEETYVEPPPPDPAAPFDFSDSKEALKPSFSLRPDQLAEVEQLWELYQNYTPAYSKIDGYITEKELLYMLKCLLLMTYTPEQLEELIAYCVRPPHPEGHITYDQFLKMVTIRQRDFPIEDELRNALLIYDPERSGNVDREYLREVLSKLGAKLSSKLLDSFIKEVDMSNDGTIGIEDVVGTLCIDLNKDDIIMLQNALNPPDAQEQTEEQF